MSQTITITAHWPNLCRNSVSDLEDALGVLKGCRINKKTRQRLEDEIGLAKTLLECFATATFTKVAAGTYEPSVIDETAVQE